MDDEPHAEVTYEVYDPEIDEAPEGNPETDCTGEEGDNGAS